jgi:hypothetical protein
MLKERGLPAFAARQSAASAATAAVRRGVGRRGGLSIFPTVSVLLTILRDKSRAPGFMRWLLLIQKSGH